LKKSGQTWWNIVGTNWREWLVNGWTAINGRMIGRMVGRMIKRVVERMV
jgi:hypothetical protein